MSSFSRAIHLAFAVGLVVVLSSAPASGSHGPGMFVARLLPGPTLGPTTDLDGGSELEQRYPYLIPRATTDRPDQRPGPQVHLVYLVPADAADERLDRFGVIEDSIRSVNHWMRKETGNLQWRLDSFAFAWDDPATPEQDHATVEAVDVTFIRSDVPADGLNTVEEVKVLLQSYGLDDPTKRYVTYVHSDGDGACGSALADPFFPFEDDQIPLVSHDSPIGYSAIYLDGDPLCRARDFASGPASPSYSEVISGHELIHNDGLAPVPAPHHCAVAPLHICTGGLGVLTLAGVDIDPERFDLMYPIVGIPLSQKQLDIGNDDYFHHPFPFRDLENSPFLERVT